MNTTIKHRKIGTLFSYLFSNLNLLKKVNIPTKLKTFGYTDLSQFWS